MTGIKAVACAIGSFATTIILWFFIAGILSILEEQHIQKLTLAFLMAFCIIVCFFGSFILLKLNKKNKKSDEDE